MVNSDKQERSRIVQMYISDWISLAAHSGPELGFGVITLISAKVLICTLYKLHGSFIILLGVYCDFFSGRTL